MAGPAPMGWPMFQSSPTPRGGRYAVGDGTQHHYHRFNPRPPLEVGATWMSLCAFPGSLQFQSSPTPRGGRYATVPGLAD